MQLETDREAECRTAIENFPFEAADWKSFEIVRGAPDSALLILCDHATNALPPKYGALGLQRGELERHIGYDIGALGVSKAIGRIMRATVISSNFSRLLIDPNRGEDDPTLIMQISDGAIVRGNAHVDERERERRLASFYRPYHRAIKAEMSRMMSRKIVPSILSMHSYTDVWRGVPRKWHAGVLWDRDPRLAVPLMKELRSDPSLEVGDNEPYSGRLWGNSISEHGTLEGFPHVLLEVRQDLIRDAKGQTEWGERIAQCFSAIFGDKEHSKALSEVAFFGAYTDMRAGARHSL